MSQNASRSQTPAFWRDERLRGWFFQAVLLAAIFYVLYSAISNARDNMQARGIPTSFDFLGHVAGFGLNQSVIPYSPLSTYGQALLVGLLNTLLVSALGCFFATLIGFSVGAARLSSNWALARLAALYVETIRNVPLLLQLLFWYVAILAPLPGPHESFALPAWRLAVPGAAPALTALVFAALGAGLLFLARGRERRAASGVGVTLAARIGGVALVLAGVALLSFGGLGGAGLAHRQGAAGLYLDNRGLTIPAPVFAPAAKWLALALGAAALFSFLWRLFARRLQKAEGLFMPVWPVAIAALILLPLAAFFLTGRPITLSEPILNRFNFEGGLRLPPEAFALVLALSLYTAAFIAEIVRGGVQSIGHGQSEAAAALGLRPAQTRKLVVMPQAMRVILPPLVSQYLVLTKNSSLAVFIGFADLMQVSGTILNQTGAAVQVIAIDMGLYLLLSMLTLLLVHLYNRRVTWSAQR